MNSAHSSDPAGRRPPLQPSLWRTCRALANRRRLRILKLLIERGERSVSELAAELRMDPALVSHYARALNARGLLRVRRRGAEVRYRAEADPSIPFVRPLLNGIRATLRDCPEPIEEIFWLVTAVTHPRRESILAELRRSSRTGSELRARVPMPSRSLYRQISKLVRRGFVIRKGRVYRCAAKQSPLARALILSCRRTSAML